jgi:proteasome lid subunit RPN8/RPN11
VIEIAAAALEDIRAHAREESPRECCGMLVGTPARVLRSVRAGNLEGGTTRFRIDPHDHVAALKWARQHQVDVVGFYHSHPASPAFPSERDLAESGYAGAMHLIVGGVEAPWCEARLFVLDAPHITELEYTVADTEPWNLEHTLSVDAPPRRSW